MSFRWQEGSGNTLAHSQCRRCHDVEVARKTREVVSSAFHLQQNACLEAGAWAKARNIERRVIADGFELNILFQPVSGNIGLDLRDHLFD